MEISGASQESVSAKRRVMRRVRKIMFTHFRLQVHLQMQLQALVHDLAMMGRFTTRTCFAPPYKKLSIFDPWMWMGFVPFLDIGCIIDKKRWGLCRGGRGGGGRDKDAE